MMKKFLNKVVPTLIKFVPVCAALMLVINNKDKKRISYYEKFNNSTSLIKFVPVCAALKLTVNLKHQKDLRSIVSSDYVS